MAANMFHAVINTNEHILDNVQPSCHNLATSQKQFLRIREFLHMVKSIHMMLILYFGNNVDCIVALSLAANELTLIARCRGCNNQKNVFSMSRQ